MSRALFRKSMKKPSSKSLDDDDDDILLGAGLLDVFQVRNGYNNLARKTLNRFGSMRITKITIYRKPIDQILDTVLNLISLGKFEEAKKDANYDKMFHLGLFFLLNDWKGGWYQVIVEKNEVIRVEQVGFDVRKWGESMVIHLPINMVGYREVTLNEFLDRTHALMGDKYFTYDAFGGNNCQVFARSMLKANELLTPQADSFIFQPLDQVVKGIGSHVPVIAKAVTTLGALINKWRGKGA